MQIHVLTPYYRPHYFEALRAALAHQDVLWHLIYESPNRLPEIADPWITVHDCRPMPLRIFDVPYWKLNWFLKNVPIIPGDRYGVICDDDSCQPDYFDRIRAAGQVPVVITSRDFGRGHGGFMADPKNMKPGRVGFQFWALGEILAKTLFREDSNAADGIMASHLSANYQTVYLPSAAGWYNALSNGRQFPGGFVPV